MRVRKALEEKNVQKRREWNYRRSQFPILNSKPGDILEENEKNDEMNMIENETKNNNKSSRRQPINSNKEKKKKSRMGPDGKYQIANGVPLIKIIESSIRFLRKLDPQHIFSMPVTDDIAPGYSQIIFSPMDISTLEKKARIYESFDEFDSDVCLMYQNCKKFNPMGDPIHSLAVDSLDKWINEREEIIDRIEKKTMKKLYKSFEEEERKKKMKSSKKDKKNKDLAQLRRDYQQEQLDKFHQKMNSGEKNLKHSSGHWGKLNSSQNLVKSLLAKNTKFQNVLSTQGNKMTSSSNNQSSSSYSTKIEFEEEDNNSSSLDQQDDGGKRRRKKKVMKKNVDFIELLDPIRTPTTHLHQQLWFFIFINFKILNF